MKRAANIIYKMYTFNFTFIFTAYDRRSFTEQLA